MGNKIPLYLFQTANIQGKSKGIARIKLSFLDKTILNSANAVKSIYLQAENAAKEGFIQELNPHVKLISLIYLAIVISIVSNPMAQVLTAIFIFSIYLLTRLSIFQIYRKIFFIALMFGFLIVLPASLNVITPGKIIFKLISFNEPTRFWIYYIPENIGFTENGIHVVLLVFLRVLNSVSFALLIVFTTPFPSFIKSFKMIGVPDTFLMIISLAYKFIFILSRTIEETYFALKSRLSGNIKSKSIRMLISGRVFFIFKRSMIIYENTYYAMVSRGYRGKIKLHSKHHFTIIDFIVLVVIVAAGIVVILF
jgi:cobalt/nickel transport system permease protein